MSTTDGAAGALGGAMPSRENDLRTLETRGIAPVPERNRYGSMHRVFTVWFSPNLVVAAFFIGTLATASFVGIGFRLGVLAIVLGTVLGALPAAYLCSWGPRTGVAQLPLARIPFGKCVVLPGMLMWLSTIAWDAINGIFGAQALQLLLHIPFWLGLAIILALQGLIGVFGYEVLHTYQKWMTVLLGIMFLILTFRISSIGNFSAAATAHGASLAGGFLLMVTLSISNTTLFVGPAAAHLLHGGDLAYFVGFAVAGLCYAGLSRVEARRQTAPAGPAVLAGVSAADPGEQAGGQRRMGG